MLTFFFALLVISTKRFQRRWLCQCVRKPFFMAQSKWFRRYSNEQFVRNWPFIIKIKTEWKYNNPFRRFAQLLFKELIRKKESTEFIIYNKQQKECMLIISVSLCRTIPFSIQNSIPIYTFRVPFSFCVFCVAAAFGWTWFILLVAFFFSCIRRCEWRRYPLTFLL